jgi:hypothetical protein
MDPVPTNAALCLIEKLQEAGGCADFAKRDVSYRLVEELRQHKLATFTYQGKWVRVRLNEQRLVELCNQSSERTERWCA